MLTNSLLTACVPLQKIRSTQERVRSACFVYNFILSTVQNQTPIIITLPRKSGVSIYFAANYLVSVYPFKCIITLIIIRQMTKKIKFGHEIISYYYQH